MRIREEERKRIMDELARNRANFSAGSKLGGIGFQKLLQYDLLIGAVVFSLFLFFNLETVEAPSTKKKEVVLNSSKVRNVIMSYSKSRAIAAQEFLENLKFESGELISFSNKSTDHNTAILLEEFQKLVEECTPGLKLSELVFVNCDTPIFVLFPNKALVVS